MTGGFRQGTLDYSNVPQLCIQPKGRVSLFQAAAVVAWIQDPQGTTRALADGRLAQAAIDTSAEAPFPEGVMLEFAHALLFIVRNVAQGRVRAWVRDASTGRRKEVDADEFWCVVHEGSLPREALSDTEWPVTRGARIDARDTLEAVCDAFGVEPDEHDLVLVRWEDIQELLGGAWTAALSSDDRRLRDSRPLFEALGQAHLLDELTRSSGRGKEEVRPAGRPPGSLAPLQTLACEILVEKGNPSLTRPELRKLLSSKGVRFVDGRVLYEKQNPQEKSFWDGMGAARDRARLQLEENMK